MDNQNILAAGDNSKLVGQIGQAETIDFGSITIEKDAISSAIISGDGNRVVIYQYQQVERSVVEDQSTKPGEIGPNPYKGLLAFQETDGKYFFGREKQIKQMWGKLRDLQEVESAIRLLPIYGPSGSGKSSLARAGLMPELARRPLPGRTQARVAVLMPGTHPLEALATVLARVATNDPTPVAKTREFVEELERVSKGGEYEGLRRIADAVPDIAVSPLIVLVDQFEEVYSLCENLAERNVFISNLLNGASDCCCHISVVVTLRSDFLGEIQKHPVLNRLFSEQGFLVPAMDEEELRQAICQPAKLAGHPLDKATVELLIKDTYGHEGTLPLLQFALTRIWEGLAEGREPAETLDAIGGVGGALAGEAQRIYESLSESEQKIAQRVFLGLVQLGEGAKDTRRRTEVKNLVSHLDSLEHYKQVIARFSTPGARLITLAANAKAVTAEVTHEALFDHWQQLQTWLDSSREDIRLQRRLDEDALYWDENGRPDGNLWRLPDLDLLRRYHQQAGDDMTPLQLEFFQASERLENKGQQLRRLRIGGLVAALVAITSSTIVAVYQLQKSQRQQVKQLAATAEALISSQPTEAVVNALAAWKLSQSVFVKFPDYPTPLSVYSSLLGAVQANREQSLLPHKAAVYCIVFTPDGKIISGSADYNVYFWDASTLKPIGRKRLLEPVDRLQILSASFSPDGQQIATGGADKTVRLWDAETLQRIGQPLKGHTDAVNSVAFSHDGQRIVSGSKDKTVRLWDAHTRQPIGQPLTGHEAEVNSVAFSHDGQWIVSGSKDNTVRLWDARTRQPIGQPLTGHKAEVNSVAFSPDGKLIVSGSKDNSMRLWDAHTRQPIGQPLTGHTDAVNSVAFSPDGQQIATGGADKTVRLWDVNTHQQIGQPLTGHTAAIISVVFSRDGQRVATGSKDNTMRLWDINTRQQIGQPLTEHTQAVKSVAVSPDGKLVATGSWNDNSVRLWDAHTLKLLEQPLRGHQAAVNSVAFSPDSKLLASGSADKTVRLWDVAKGQPIGQPLTGHTDAVNSVAFSPDSKWLASGSADKTVRLWDVTTRQPIGQPLTGHTDAVNSVAFGSNSSLIVSGGNDKSLRLWNISEESLVQTACQQLQHHSSLVNPKTDVATQANETCQSMYNIEFK
jgi:WD40 repeat protein